MSWFKKLQFWKSSPDAISKDVDVPKEADLMELLTEGTQADCYSKLVIDQFALLHAKLAAQVTSAYKAAKEVKVLDLAAAGGEPAISIAKALPNAIVTSTDIAPENVDLGKARAAAAGVSSVTFETADAEDLSAYATSSFDIVTCSLGLMFVPNFEKALKEFHRVLKREGTLVLAVWGPIDQADGPSIFFNTFKELGIVSTLDPFKFGDAELLQNALRPLGFAFRVQKFSVPMTFPDVATTTAAALGHPLRAALAEGKKDVIEKAPEIFRKLAGEKGFLKKDGSLEFPKNEILIFTATKM